LITDIESSVSEIARHEAILAVRAIIEELGVDAIPTINEKRRMVRFSAIDVLITELRITADE